MTEITAPAGFFWDNAVSPTTATDLLTAVEEAEANVNNSLQSATDAAASATAAAASALSASGAQSAAATSETNAATSASSAATQATNAATSATAAASSATSAATSATNASSSASAAASSATAAASSATAAANSATNAATSATNAAASATTASNAAATIPAPSVGTSTNYIRVNASGNAYEKRTVAQVASDIGALNDVGRNKLHNPLFNIWQRGTGAFTTLNAYTADRWIIGGVTDTVSVTRQALADVDRVGIGDDEAAFCLQNTFSGTTGTGAFNSLVQRMEGVRRLASKTIRVSFYAKANSGTPKIGVSVDQFFGTGGSPSASVNGSGTAVTISASWAYYTVQLSVPSVAGKTLGTNSDDNTALNLWFSASSGFATRAGSIGAQSGTIKLWGVQLEVGTVVTPLEKPDPGRDLLLCQRFYSTGQAHLIGYANSSSIFVGTSIPFPTTMQQPPTVTIGSTIGVDSNVTSAAADNPAVSGFRFVLTSTATGMVAGSRNYTATADL